ncbi:hypothetical protein MMYC01_202097, partial [Madurella mycetomatis]
MARVDSSTRSEVDDASRLISRHWSHRVIETLKPSLKLIHTGQQLYAKKVEQAILRGGHELDSLDHVAVIIGIMAFTSSVAPNSWHTAVSKLPKPPKIHFPQIPRRFQTSREEPHLEEVPESSATVIVFGPRIAPKPGKTS